MFVERGTCATATLYSSLLVFIFCCIQYRTKGANPSIFHAATLGNQPHLKTVKEAMIGLASCVC